MPVLNLPAPWPPALGRPARPLSVVIAHNKGGVSKTTSTYLLGRLLARDLRVELVDLDQTQYLREAVVQLSPRGDLSARSRKFRYLCWGSKLR